MNTKHSKEDSKTYEHITDENDMFQIEMVEDEIVYACNICDQGFKISEEVKKHITKVPQDILNHILTKVTNERVLMGMRSEKSVIKKRNIGLMSP